MKSEIPAPSKLNVALSTHRKRTHIVRLALLVPFLMMGCSLGQNSEQSTPPDVSTAPAAESTGSESAGSESAGSDGVFSKGASSASEQPESQPSEAPEAENPSEEGSSESEQAETPSEFNDIADLPTQEVISTLNQLQVFDESGNQFRPYDSITRGEYITWMYKANNAIRRETEHLRPAPTFDPGFTDIDSSHPAYQYVQAFANAGYAVGYTDSTFKPDQPITREEMIALKVGLDTGEDYPPRKDIRGLNFSDADQIDEKYTGYIWRDRVTKNGARAFGSVKNLKPKQVAKRHEAAATLAIIRQNHAKRVLERQQRELERQKKRESQ